MECGNPFGITGCPSGLERLCIPVSDVDRPCWLVTAGRDTEKVNHPDLVLVCCSKPLVVGSIRITPHERIVDAAVAVVDLVVSY